MQVLDVTGPLEVFSNGPEYRVVLATPDDSRTVRTHRGIALSGAVPLSELTEPIDTLIVAGGQGAENGPRNEVLREWLLAAAKDVRRLAAICTGALVLADAGLLDGRRAVTHWSFCDRLAREYPKVTVDPEPIFLKDGNIYTSAGITAGIDLSLALVEEDHGHAVALEIARFLVMFLVRPGGQAQFSSMLSQQVRASEPIRELQVWILQNLRKAMTVEMLAERVGLSPRHFARVCAQETSMTPAQLVERLRVETAQRLIGSSKQGLKFIADECGFGSAEMMRRSFVRVLGISASDYEKRFSRRAAGSLA